MKTEVASLLIITKLTQYDYVGAAAIAFVLLVLSFMLLLVLNGLQGWSARRLGY
jgi:sulfate/thiosulfate transport system permease protein